METSHAAKLKEEIVRLAATLSDDLFSFSRALYDDPELSLEEHRAAARLAELLSGGGYQVERGVAGLPTSFVAAGGGLLPGPRIGILAEYDALPGVGHGCGHNLIAASALGAGLILGRLRERLPGEVRIIGTPAEETVGGKALMVREGVFRDLDAAMMIHPGTEFRVHTTSLACQSIQIVFEGKASHAVAAPDRGVNALDPLVQLYVGIDAMRKGLTPEVRIPGVIVEGGKRANIVPDRAVGRFSVRARNRTAVGAVLDRIVRMANSLSAAGGARVVVTRIDEAYDEMLTNRVMADLFKENLRSLGVETNDAPRERMGSLDMGNVSQVVPSLHAYVAIVPDTGALHTREFAEATVSESGRRGLLLAAQALAMTAVDLVTQAEAVPAARREFLAATGQGGE
ncbi:MAG TPA: M20 family metallopeptidase [Candidatus Polarisedimenticolia bacterium]|nr:M20 family metallopeptidase [Candidatus Polarisedimenticolia bacterium]